MGEGAHIDVSEVSSGPLGVLLLILMVMGGSAFIYTFVVVGELIAVEVSVLILILATFCSLAYAIIAPREEEAAAGGAIALASVISVVTILVPSSGNVYIDAAVMTAVAAVAVVAFSRSVRLPPLQHPQLGLSTVAVVLFLPMLLAFAEALFLGLRFWENYRLGSTSLLFIPLIAVYGYVEEGLFRGVVQRSLAPLTGTSVAIVAGALLDASYMMFWGSIMYVVFAFLTSLLLGALYARSRSLMYVGTLHALQDTWLIIAVLVMGIIA